MKPNFSEAIQSQDSVLDWTTKAIEELVEGHDCAVQLQNLIDESQQKNIHHHDLVLKIMDSFTNILSKLKNDNDGDKDHLFYSYEAVSDHQIIMTNTQLNSSPTADQDSTCTGESIKQRDSRESHKRRKCSASWTTQTINLMDDGHAWRKYGQKIILRAKYPRSYFRCTHKYDQGCNATKQVQQISANPSVYRSTYYGHHTCQNFIGSSQLILDSSTNDDTDSTMINFGNKTVEKNPFSLSFTSKKHERHDDNTEMSTNGHKCHHNRYNFINHHQPSSSEYLVSCHELPRLEESLPEHLKLNYHGFVGYSADFDDYLDLQSQLFDELCGS